MARIIFDQETVIDERNHRDNSIITKNSSHYSDTEIVYFYASHASIDLPSSSFVTDVQFIQVGSDLQLILPSGEAVIVVGYFSQLQPPALKAKGSVELSSELVQSFLMPVAPGQVAQMIDGGAGDPIGSIEFFSGKVFAIRADGVKVELRLGDPVYQRDQIETDSDGSVKMKFVDKTIFTLGGGARLALDELVFDASTTSGTSAFSILKGCFLFISGRIAHDSYDNMVVTTPVATIGIRGTTVTGSVLTGETAFSFSVLEGTIAVASGGEIITLNENFGTVIGESDASGNIRVAEVSQPQSNVISNSSSALQALGDTDLKAIGAATSQEIEDKTGEKVNLDLKELVDNAVEEAEAEKEVEKEEQNSEPTTDIQTEIEGIEPETEQAEAEAATKVEEEPEVEVEEDALEAEPDEESELEVELEASPDPERDQQSLTSKVEEKNLVTTTNTLNDDDFVSPATIPSVSSLASPVVYPSVNYIMDPNDVSYLATTDGDHIVIGNNLVNTITTNGGDDTIAAEGGNDIVISGAGDDTIIGGSGEGDDYYNGGTGTDLLKYDSVISAGLDATLGVGWVGSGQAFGTLVLDFGDSAGDVFSTVYDDNNGIIDKDAFTNIELLSLSSQADQVFVNSFDFSDILATNIDGKDGHDTVKYLGKLEFNASYFHATASDGNTTQTLTNIETISNTSTDELGLNVPSFQATNGDDTSSLNFNFGGDVSGTLGQNSAIFNIFNKNTNLNVTNLGRLDLTRSSVPSGVIDTTDGYLSGSNIEFLSGTTLKVGSNTTLSNNAIVMQADSKLQVEAGENFLFDNDVAFNFLDGSTFTIESTINHTGNGGSSSALTIDGTGKFVNSGVISFGSSTAGFDVQLSVSLQNTGTLNVSGSLTVNDILDNVEGLIHGGTSGKLSFSESSKYFVSSLGSSGSARLDLLTEPTAELTAAGGMEIRVDDNHTVADGDQGLVTFASKMGDFHDINILNSAGTGTYYGSEAGTTTVGTVYETADTIGFRLKAVTEGDETSINDQVLGDANADTDDVFVGGGGNYFAVSGTGGEDVFYGGRVTTLLFYRIMSSIQPTEAFWMEGQGV